MTSRSACAARAAHRSAAAPRSRDSDSRGRPSDFSSSRTESRRPQAAQEADRASGKRTPAASRRSRSVRRRADDDRLSDDGGIGAEAASPDASLSTTTGGASAAPSAAATGRPSAGTTVSRSNSDGETTYAQTRSGSQPAAVPHPPATLDACGRSAATASKARCRSRMSANSAAEHGRLTEPGGGVRIPDDDEVAGTLRIRDAPRAARH